MNKQTDFLLWVTDNFYVANGVPHLWYRKPVQSPAVPQGGLTAEQLEVMFEQLKVYSPYPSNIEAWLDEYEKGVWSPLNTPNSSGITCSTNDYQLLISINNIPHLCIRKSHLTGFQGYIKGEDAKVWYIEFYTKYGNFVSEYDNREIWEQVLDALGKAKIFKPQL